MVAGEERPAPNKLRRFLVEAESVAAVRHPNVVEVFEYGEYAGRPFLALEYLPNGSLADRLHKNGKFTSKDAAQLVATLADAVQAAHDCNIIHRDLKPANVLYDATGHPKVTDFGLAKRLGGLESTNTHTIMGTAPYMAPENVRAGSKYLGPQADIYALGVMLYECLTGNRPFDDPDPNVVIHMAADQDPDPPRRRVPSIERDIELVCLKCLEKEPARRYESAAALAVDLKRFVNDEQVSVRSSGPIERAAKWARRKPALATAYALTFAVVFLCGFGAVAAVLWRMSERDRLAANEARSEAAARPTLGHEMLHGHRPIVTVDARAVGAGVSSHPDALTDAAARLLTGVRPRIPVGSRTQFVLHRYARSLVLPASGFGHGHGSLSHTKCRQATVVGRGCN
jgi:hypothetical protein